MKNKIEYIRSADLGNGLLVLMLVVWISAMLGFVAGEPFEQWRRSIVVTAVLATVVLSLWLYLVAAEQQAVEIHAEVMRSFGFTTGPFKIVWLDTEARLQTKTVSDPDELWKTLAILVPANEDVVSLVVAVEANNEIRFDFLVSGLLMEGAESTEAGMLHFFKHGIRGLKVSRAK